MPDKPISCFLVDRDKNGEIHTRIDRLPPASFPVGPVEIAVEFSSLNYKDTLAATGHRGIVREFPHVPGIDAAGRILSDNHPDFPSGTEVLVTGFDLGASRWGGWAERISVPAEWVIPLPEGLSLHRSMQLGTAGLTAALAIDALVTAGLTASRGPVLVTGATGGVGLLSVAILARLGFDVVASTGKEERHDLLRQHGASTVINRQEVLDPGEGPLGSGRWAAAIDSVGGDTLTAIIRTLQSRGCVAACGLVGGAELPLTVYPFLLRGITLAGVDSAFCPRQQRIAFWQQLAGDWSPGDLAGATQDTRLDEIDTPITLMRAGEHVGRTVVQIS